MLACSIPVITYKTDGSPESIDKWRGNVFAQEDVRGVADAIIKMAANSGNLALLGENSKHYFEHTSQFFLAFSNWGNDDNKN